MKEWRTGALKSLDPDVVDADHRKMLMTATKLTNRFEGKLPKPQKLASKIQKDLKDFRAYIPIIKALCNPALSSPDMADTNGDEIFFVVGM